MALSQLQPLARENAALRQEQDNLLHQLDVLDRFVTVLRERYPRADFGTLPEMARDAHPACLGPSPDAESVCWTLPDVIRRRHT